MNKLLLGTISILLLVVIYAFNSNNNIPAVDDTAINWISIEEAEKASKSSKKLIFMDVYTDWCGPCKMLDRNTFSDPEVIKYINANYHSVKFNAESQSELTFNGKKYANPNFDPSKKGRNSAHEFTRYLNVRGYPTMYVLEGSGKIVNNLVGYRTPDQLMEELTK